MSSVTSADSGIALDRGPVQTHGQSAGRDRPASDSPVEDAEVVIQKSVSGWAEGSTGLTVCTARSAGRAAVAEACARIGIARSDTSHPTLTACIELPARTAPALEALQPRS